MRIIFHPYNPLARPRDQIETWEFIRDQRIIARDTPCQTPYSYYLLLIGYLSCAESTIIIEQDIVPTREQYDELLICPEPFCVSDYKINVDGKLGSWKELLSKGNEAHYCLGFSKLPRINPVNTPAISWKNVAYIISQELDKRGFKPHYHSEVKHNHTYE